MTEHKHLPGLPLDRPDHHPPAEDSLSQGDSTPKPRVAKLPWDSPAKDSPTPKALRNHRPPRPRTPLRLYEAVRTKKRAPPKYPLPPRSGRDESHHGGLSSFARAIQPLNLKILVP